MQNQGNEYMGGQGAPTGTAGRAWEGESAEAASGTRRRAQKLREQASDTLRSARDRAAVAYDRTADQATRAYYGARGYAQSNPGVAAATTFAAGLGLGMLLGGRSVARAYRRRFVPMLGMALAQTVRDVFTRSR